MFQPKQNLGDTRGLADDMRHISTMGRRIHSRRGVSKVKSNHDFPVVVWAAGIEIRDVGELAPVVSQAFYGLAHRDGVCNFVWSKRYGVLCWFCVHFEH